MSFNAYITECIKYIEYNYSSKEEWADKSSSIIEFTDELVCEINAVHDMTSGCEFIDWLNHRLFIVIQTKRILAGEDYVEYKDDLSNPDDEDEDEEEEDESPQ